MRGPKMRLLLVLGLLVLFAADYVAAQSLPPCALNCVSKTKTKCKSNDYVCACSDGKYLPRLTQCIDKKCDDASRPQAHSYLASLCLAVGYPILDHGDAGAVLELRELAQVPAERVEIIEKRQNETSPTRTRSSTLSSPTRNSTSTRSSGTSSPTGNSDNNGFSSGGGSSSSSSGGIKKGAKIGIGVAVPLVLGVLAFLVVLFKKHQAKKAGTNPTDPSLPPYAPGADPSKQPYMVGPTGPAELPQDAQYIGHEMPTQHNAAEMPAVVPPPGTVQPYAPPVQGQPQEVQGQQVQPQQVQPQPGQPQPVQPPAGYAASPVPYPQPGQVPFFPPGSPQYTQPAPAQYPASANAANPQPAQVYYPPLGQPQNPTADPQHYPPPGQQWPGQQQQQAPAELPERMKSPQ